MTKWTKDIKNHTKCFYIISAPNKRYVGKHIKSIGGFYNGVGWYIPENYEDHARKICQETDSRMIEHPLTKSFEEFRKEHHKHFFEEKRIQARMKADSLKLDLEINLDNEVLKSDEYRKMSKDNSKLKDLLDLIDEHDRIQEQIDRIEEEERLNNLSIKETIDIKPYTLEELQKELSQTKEGLKTGYKELDDMLRIPNEAITLIGGRPSHGKTTFMLNLFLNLIRQYPDHHFYFFSYEETRQQIAVKIINILSGFLFEEQKNLIQLEGYLRLGTTSFGMVERGKKEYQELVESGRLRIISEPFYIQQLPLILSSLKSKVHLGAIFIDYIQKIKNKEKFGTRQLELANTSSIILESAKNYSLPIILGAQLGRDKESKDKVKLDNLREAGDLEQDANLVLGLFNPSMEKAQDEQLQLKDRKVELKVTPLKNRNGIVNKTIKLDFDRPLLTITDKM